MEARLRMYMYLYMYVLRARARACGATSKLDFASKRVPKWLDVATLNMDSAIKRVPGNA